jgi:hypothetical protein
VTEPAQPNVVLLCPTCGERLTVESKSNSAGDRVARRACPVGDYAEPWTPASPLKGDRLGNTSERLQTATGVPRMAPLPALPARPKVV